MSTTAQYDQLIAEMPEGLAADIMTVLAEAYRNAPGQNVKRETLVYLIFDKKVEAAKLSTCTEDRQIRETIEDLQHQGYRIVSQSGKPGYRLAVDDADAQEYINELESRKTQLENKIRALRTPRIQPKLAYQKPVIATQPALI